MVEGKITDIIELDQQHNYLRMILFIQVEFYSYGHKNQLILRLEKTFLLIYQLHL